MKYTLTENTRCQRDDNGYRCNGHHLNSPASERPKLEGLDAELVVERLLATKQWAGSTVERGTSREMQVRVFDAKNKPTYRHEPQLREVVVLHHPSGATAAILK